MSVASKAGRLAGALAAFLWMTSGAWVAGAEASPAQGGSKAQPGHGLLKPLQREWWQWVASIPASQNPVLDADGTFCTVGQRGDFWFLAGTFGEDAHRTCTVPKGVKLLVPVVTTFCFPDASYPDQQCIDDVGAFIYGASGSVTWDSRNVGVVAVCEVASRSGRPPRGCSNMGGTSVFNIAVPDIDGLVDGGIYRVNSVSGLWAVIDTSRASQGPHVLQVNGRSGDGYLEQHFTYDIQVVGPAN